MHRLLLLAGALLLINARPAPVATVSLKPGEALTLLVQRDGLVTETSREPAQSLDDFERKIAEEFASGKHETAVGPNTVATVAGEGPEPRPVETGKLRIKFTRLPDGGSFLVLYNGYRRAVTYRAVMHGNGSARPTDVCQVLPRLRATEYWPYPIEQLDLSAFRLDPWTKDAPPLCG